MQTPALQTRKFDVVIPNLEEDGIAEMVAIDVQVYYDPAVGEEILTPESVQLIENTKARRLGLMLPEEIRQLREDRLELTQDEIGEFLQIGAKTYTRWETGRARPPRSVNVLLCALRDGVLSADYLRALLARRPASAPAARERIVLRHMAAKERRERKEVRD